MGSIKAVILILASAVLVSCGMPEDNTEETLQGFWIESTGESHAQVFGKTIIFSSILRSYPKRSFNIIPSGSKKYIVLDGKSSTIELKDNLLSLTVSGFRCMLPPRAKSYCLGKTKENIGKHRKI